ncbi:MAG: hypothetical protein J5629_02010 [Muribaculaceae bacterium]|nr:hypothetical protein [Muribaculaceae bacterium]
MRRILQHITLAILVTASLTVIATSCNNDNCIGNGSAIPLAGFYNGDKQITINSLTVYGIGAPNDSVIINKTSAKSVYLPLRLSTNSCKYVFNYNTEDMPNDTLTLGYDAIPYFQSHECGAMYKFKITSLEHTTHAIDSVLIPEPMITNADVVSIKIYVR